MNIKQATDLFIEDIGNRKAQGTKLGYRNGIRVLLEHMREKKVDLSSPIQKFSMEYAILLPSFLGKMGYSKKTTNLYTSGVRSFINWLVVQGHINPTPQEWLRLKQSFLEANSKREKRLPRWPEKEDVEKMLKAVRIMKEHSPRLERNIAIVEFLACTGCRNAEICGLNIEKVNIHERSAIVLGKGNKERRVFLSDTALQALNNYWKARGNSEPKNPVFSRHDKGAGKKVKRITMTSIRDIIKVVMDIAGIDKFSPHYFRHAFAIKMLRETGNLAMVQDLMGHDDPASTRVYAKIYPDELQAAHRKVYG